MVPDEIGEWGRLTSEVILMNRLAVAMAADSAVTIGDGVKIYQSAIKLFTLSKYQPVGVMVYNTASILGYPWETIIKTFRHHLGSEVCPTVADYAKKFQAFLHANEKGLFTGEMQRADVISSAREELETIANLVRKKWWDVFPDGKSHLDFLADVLNARLGKAGEAKLMACFPADFQDKVTAHYLDDFVRLAGEAFDNFGVTEDKQDEFERLKHDAARLIVLRITTDAKFGNYSGLVFAGFGANQYLPAMVNIIVDGVICDHLKWSLEQDIAMEPAAMAFIQPFAQSQMVSTFMNGVDPDLRSLGAMGSIQMGVELSKLIVNSITDIPEDRKEHWINESRTAAIDAWNKYQDQLSDHIRANHQQPLRRIIGSLPKDELAEVAESMVSLNALKMKVSQAKETVGGPIDVAVITKGDGFIWIKRKHYFSPELNPQFSANYYRSDEGISAHAGLHKAAKPELGKRPRRIRRGKKSNVKG